MRVDRFHQAKGVDVLFNIGMGAHGEAVYTCIGSASGMYRDSLAGHAMNGIFDGFLHRWAMVLALPAHIGAAVKFDGEPETSHERTVPAGMALPRRRSAVGMAGLPARWISVGRSNEGALLLVVHTFTATGPNSALVRIISARAATRNERRQYEQGTLQ